MAVKFRDVPTLWIYPEVDWNLDGGLSVLALVRLPFPVSNKLRNHSWKFAL